MGAALAREIAPPLAAPPVAHVSFGVSWGQTLEGALARGFACREASSMIVACALGRGVWLRDAQTAQLLFDGSDGQLAAVVVVSQLLLDRDPDHRGREIKRRFVEIKRTTDGLLPPGYTASVRLDPPAGVAFWSGLRAAVGRGTYAARWTTDAEPGGPTISLRLYGVDANRGFYKMLVERPA